MTTTERRTAMVCARLDELAYRLGARGHAIEHDDDGYWLILSGSDRRTIPLGRTRREAERSIRATYRADS